MQRSALWSIPLLSLAASLAAGCNDLGTCDDPLGGRRTVRDNDTVMYAGQAVMLRSCAASICHSSRVKGAARLGAPAGLDFDLLPLEPHGLISDDAGIKGVQVDPAELAKLRARQRKVFDERENIWEQIDKGLMPPGEAGKAFKSFMSIFGLTYDSTGQCTKGEALPTLDSAKEVLRDWLACGTPIVETSSTALPWAPPAEGNLPESSSGAHAYAGQAGYQLPACGGGEDGGATFAQVYAIFENANYGCTSVGCHGGNSPQGMFDIGTIEKAYTTLLGANGMGGRSPACGTAPPYVTPRDPSKSYILNMVDAKLSDRCAPIMPLGQSAGLPEARLQVIRNWILAGAPREGVGTGGGAGASDAGASDGGASDAGRDGGV